jgi:hypothetical protein
MSGLSIPDARDFMSSLTRIFVCAVAMVMFACFAFLMVAIFGPLAFPSSLDDSSPEDIVAPIGGASVLVFAVVGAIAGWKLTARRTRL